MSKMGLDLLLGQAQGGAAQGQGSGRKGAATAAATSTSNKPKKAKSTARTGARPAIGTGERPPSARPEGAPAAAREKTPRQGGGRPLTPKGGRGKFGGSSGRPPLRKGGGQSKTSGGGKGKRSPRASKAEAEDDTSALLSSSDLLARAGVLDTEADAVLPIGSPGAPDAGRAPAGAPPAGAPPRKSASSQENSQSFKRKMTVAKSLVHKIGLVLSRQTRRLDDVMRDWDKKCASPLSPRLASLASPRSRAATAMRPAIAPANTRAQRRRSLSLRAASCYKPRATSLVQPQCA